VGAMLQDRLEVLVLVQQLECRWCALFFQCLLCLVACSSHQLCDCAFRRCLAAHVLGVAALAAHMLAVAALPGGALQAFDICCIALLTSRFVSHH
jgi:hypothetical protein